MTLQLMQTQRHSQKLKQILKLGISLTGGLTSRTIFPRAEEKLVSHTDYQKGLDFVGRKKDMTKYNSIMDFLLCESLPIFKNKCFEYYEGKGQQLIDDECFNIEMRKKCDEFLCFVLDMCLIMWNKKLGQSWKSMRLSATIIFFKEEKAA